MSKKKIYLCLRYVQRIQTPLEPQSKKAQPSNPTERLPIVGHPSHDPISLLILNIKSKEESNNFR